MPDTFTRTDAMGIEARMNETNQRLNAILFEMEAFRRNQEALRQEVALLRQNNQYYTTTLNQNLTMIRHDLANIRTQYPLKSTAPILNPYLF